MDESVEDGIGVEGGDFFFAGGHFWLGIIDTLGSAETKCVRKSLLVPRNGIGVLAVNTAGGALSDNCNAISPAVDNLALCLACSSASSASSSAGESLIGRNRCWRPINRLDVRQKIN